MTEQQTNEIIDTLKARHPDVPKQVLETMVGLAVSAYSQGYEDGFVKGQKIMGDVQNRIMDSLFQGPRKKPPQGGTSEGDG